MAGFVALVAADFYEPFFSEGHKELAVKGPCVEEEGTSNAFDLCDDGGVERRAGQSCVGILDLGAVVEFVMLVGGRTCLTGASL